jgi:hypothetical protein
MRPPPRTAPFPASYAPEVISKILYLRKRNHLGPRRIADYLRRFHHLAIARSSVHEAIQLRSRAGHWQANKKLLPFV